MAQQRTTLMAVAEQVASEAGELVRAAYERMRRGDAVEFGTKTSETDVVTATDTESERLIRARLADLRPGEVVLGEEEGGAAGSSEVTWVVDPIDGTVNFLHGYPMFAVSVGAQVEGRTVAGAVVDPINGRTWTAERGGGAWLDGIPLRVSSPCRLDLALVATGFAYRVERRRAQADVVQALLGRVADIRRGGSAALDLCAVASGWFDAYYEHGLSRWDWAAGSLVAEESGATVLLPGQGDRIGADAILTASPSIADELAEALAACGAGKV